MGHGSCGWINAVIAGVVTAGLSCLKKMSLAPCYSLTHVVSSSMCNVRSWPSPNAHLPCRFSASGIASQ
jgi:hypothetical protein